MRELGDLSDSEIATWKTVSEEFVQQGGPFQTDRRKQAYIDSTSDLYVKYVQDSRIATLDNHLEAAREPDTTIELLPMAPQSPEYFQEFLDYHLRCQVRDTFVMMGVHPPEEYRVLGLGRFAAMTQYSSVDVYPKLYDSEINLFD